MKNSDSRQFLSLPTLWGVCLFLVQFCVRPPSIRLGPDPYWAVYWIFDYSHGFQKRSLIGAFLRCFGDWAANYWVIAALSWIAMASFWFLLLQLILRFLSGFSVWSKCFYLTVFILSPSWTGLLFEVVGDPLQLVFLAFILLFYKTLKQENIGMKYLSMWVVFCFSAVFVHEAAVFFILPALATAIFKSADFKKIFLICVVSISLALSVILLRGGIHPAWMGQVINVPCLSCFSLKEIGGFLQGVSHEFVVVNPDIAHSFHQLFQIELQDYWEKGLTFNAQRFFGALLLPLMQSWIICSLYLQIFKSEIEISQIFRVWIRWYVSPIGATFPLWAIAHDWGRFAGYSLILQTAVLFLSHLNSLKCKENFFIQDGQFLKVQTFICCLVSAICTSPVLGTYRINGVFSGRFLVVGIIFGIIFVWIVFNKRKRINSHAG